MMATKLAVLMMLPLLPPGFLRMASIAYCMRFERADISNRTSAEGYGDVESSPCSPTRLP
jgi:hypothetical protein